MVDKPIFFRTSPENQRFYLLHLSLVREFLEIEFSSALRDQLSFGFDFERVLDDFILLMFFVGNDFVPNVQDFHIHDGAVGTLFTAYKEILPQLGLFSYPFLVFSGSDYHV